MKSQRRHELQKNTLSAELSKVGEFLQKHGYRLTIAVLVVAIVALLAIYFNNQAAQAHQRDVYELSLWMQGQTEQLTAERKAELAAADDEQIAATAHYLMGRDKLRQALEAAAGGPGADELFAGAREDFQAVIRQYPGQPAIVAKARAALAVIAEQQGDLDRALEHCRGILEMNSLNEGYPVYVRAGEMKRRLSDEETREPVKLATRPRPRTQLRMAANRFLQAAAMGEELETLVLPTAVDQVRAQAARLEAYLDAHVTVEPADYHISGLEGMFVTEQIELDERRKGAIVLRLTRSEGEWRVRELDVKPVDVAEKLMEDFRRASR